MKSAAEELSVARQKRGRPIGSKYSVPRKRKMIKQCSAANDDKNLKNKLLHKSNQSLKRPETLAIHKLFMRNKALKRHMNPENSEISVDYTHGKIIINDVFAFTIATDIINDPDPQTIDECRLRHDWLKWKEVIQVELTFLAKREVFGPVVQTPKDVKPVGYK